MSDRPLAAAGLISFRYPSAYGWVMIGARDHVDALVQANRSLDRPTAQLDQLEVWDPEIGAYVLFAVAP